MVGSQFMVNYDRLLCAYSEQCMPLSTCCLQFHQQMPKASDSG